MLDIMRRRGKKKREGRKEEKTHTSRTWLALLALPLSPSLSVKRGDSARSSLSTLVDSHESALHVALLPSSSRRLPERKRRAEKEAEMAKEGKRV